jgi:hypothetical protein
MLTVGSLLWLCGSIGCTVPEPIKQKYVLELVYENLFFIFEVQQAGMFVTNEGDVYQFQRDIPYIEPLNGIYTRASLDRKYDSQLTLVGHVELPALRAIFALFPYAQKGALSDPMRIGFGQGSYFFNGFTYNEGLDTYIPFLLWETGDTEAFNLADEAETIVNFLLDTAENYGLPVPDTLFR